MIIGKTKFLKDKPLYLVKKVPLSGMRSLLPYLYLSLFIETPISLLVSGTYSV